MGEIIFLALLGLVWILFATIQDLKFNEIANWLNFSLIIFALGYRFFFSLFSQNGFNFFFQGIFGLALFFVIGNLFYYGKLFAGGDAKLLIALGPILAIRESYLGNLETMLLFLLIFLLTGALYTLVSSVYHMSKNFNSFKKEFVKQSKKYREIHLMGLVFAVLLGALSVLMGYDVLIWISILMFISPWLYIYSKAVDESAMIKSLNPKDLREGDWIYEDIKIGNKKIKANWEGLSKKDIKLIQKKMKNKSKIKIRKGVPFAPVFLISYSIYFIWVLF